MAARIHELRAARYALAQRANAALTAARDRAKAEGRSLTTDETAMQDDFDAKLKAADEEIAIEDRLLDRERAQGSAAPPRDPTARPVPGHGPRLGAADVAARTPAGGIGKRYAELFGAPRPLAAEGWNGGPSFFEVLSGRLAHPALVSAARMGEGVGSEGGFLVPDEFTARAFDGAVEDEPVLQLVTFEPMLSQTKIVAGFASKNHSTAGPFGFAGGWLGEGESMTPEKALVRAVKLVAKKLGLLVQASGEVVADGTSFEAQLLTAMQKALGWMLAEAIFNGSGAGQPLGVLNAPCTISTAKENNQAADTIVYANLTQMLSRLLPSCVSRAVWFASHTARPQLMQLSVVVGVGSTFIPLVVQGGRYYLLGIPLYFTEHLPVVGDAGDLVLGDFSQYALGMRREISMDKSMHVGFTSDLMSYRGIVRADGMPVFDAPFTPKNGATQAPFVTLAAR